MGLLFYTNSANSPVTGPDVSTVVATTVSPFAETFSQGSNCPVYTSPTNLPRMHWAITFSS